MNKKYVILGGGGSFGIQTAYYFLRHTDDKVIGIGRNPLRPHEFSLGVEHEPRFTYRAFHTTYELDLLMEYLDKEKPNYIINYAAQGEGAVSWRNSWRYFETNSMGLVRLAEELAKRDWLERFVQIGTSEMYGSVTAPAKEDAPIKPSSPYAASKVAFDMYLQSIGTGARILPWNIIRPSNAYCPGQLLHRVVPRAILCGLTGQKLPLQGGGHAQKSYIYANDLAAAIDIVIHKAPLGTIYNVGPPEPIAIRDLVANIAVLLDMQFDELCTVVDDRPGQDGCYWLDSSAITALGWEQDTLLSSGLKEVIFWISANLDKLRTYSTDYVFRG